MDEVNRAGDDLGTTPFGRDIQDLLFEVLKPRMAELDGPMATTHCCNLLTHRQHGIIESDYGVITQRTTAGFGSICQKLYKIFSAYHTSSRDLVYRLDPHQEKCYQ